MAMLAEVAAYAARSARQLASLYPCVHGGGELLPHLLPPRWACHCLPAGTGKTKKSGAGGKFTWGSMLTDGDEAAGALDRNDPNYNSGEAWGVLSVFNEGCGNL